MQYHFRTKDVLRDEANKYAHALVRDVFGYLEPANDAESRRRLSDRLRHFTQDESTVLRHVARGVADRDPGALTIFDAYVDIAARHVSPRTTMHLVVRILGDALLRPALEEHRQNKPTASGN